MIEKMWVKIDLDAGVQPMQGCQCFRLPDPLGRGSSRPN